ncbi:MAG: hypothetical protein U9R19_04140 [Bacteroidota bacterium]|nr:hypothetical protein [Bacteroidota bacterium]
MNNKEHKELLEAFKKYTKKLISSKKESRDFLVRSGIHNKKGELNQDYISAK